MKKLLVVLTLSAVQTLGCSSDPNRNSGNVIVDREGDLGMSAGDMGDAGDASGIFDVGPPDMGSEDIGPDTADVCIPETDEEMCDRLSFECGPLMEEDNCGEMRTIDDCDFLGDACTGFDTCAGGGEPGLCGCTPETCESLGVLCGEVADSCGGTLMCDLFCVDSVTVGGDHGCAIGSGKVKCWGAGADGKLGNDGSQDQRNPVDVDWSGASVQVVQASAGGGNTCVVDAAGRVVCWGDNSRGQLGIGTTVSTSKPDAAAIATGGTEVKAGFEHVCAISAGGKVSCWGSNDYGQIGDPQLTIGTNIAVPLVPAGLDTGVTALSTGWNHTCVIQDTNNMTGVLKCWGRNRFGQTAALTADESLVLSTGGNVPTFVFDRNDGWDLLTLVNEPTAVPDPENTSQPWTGLKAVATGGTHTCVIDSQDRLWCWGLMPGADPDTSCPDVDTKTPKLCSIFPQNGGIAIATGTYNTQNELNVSGIEAIWVANAPVEVNMDGKTPTAIAAGEDHHCAIVSNPTANSSNMLCFGLNGFGQLGDGTTNNWTAPRNVFLDVDDNPVLASELDAGNAHTCAVGDDNSVKCWGSNAKGQIGNSSLQRDSTYRPYDVRLEVAAP